MALSPSLASLFLDSSRWKLDQGSRRYCVHEINLSRERLGELFILFQDLWEDEERFWRYFRTTINTFDCTLEAIRPVITKGNTNFRKSITLEENLMITLR